MRLHGVALKEARARWVHTLTGIFTIAMGTALVVAMVSILESYKERIEDEVLWMGPSAVLIPGGLETSDFLMGEHKGFVFPLAYADRIVSLAQDKDVVVEPRLVYDYDAAGINIHLAGLTSGGYQTPGLHNGVTVGRKAAEYLTLSDGGTLELFDRRFIVEKVLGENGTDDDITVFFNLSVLQEASRRGELVNEIRIFCDAAAVLTRIEDSIGRELPGVKMVTRRRVLEARQKTVRSLARYGVVVSVAVLLVAIISVANQIASSIEDRKREIAILAAVGAPLAAIQRLFLCKASLMGGAGSISGYLMGTILGYVLGLHFADLNVRPLVVLFPVSVMSVTILVLLASYVPAQLIARISPADVLSNTAQ